MESCGTTFRWPVNGDDNGYRDGLCGAWEMDTDGRPKVNMPKARTVHMDSIRKVRDAELAKPDVLFMKALESGARTPTQLNGLWPPEIPGSILG